MSTLIVDLEDQQSDNSTYLKLFRRNKKTKKKHFCYFYRIYPIVAPKFVQEHIRLYIRIVLDLSDCCAKILKTIQLQFAR